MNPGDVWSLTNYSRGYAFENWLCRELGDQGFDAVRTAGSHGVFDILAFDENRFVLIQCKTTRSKTWNYKKDIEKLMLTSVPANTVKLLAVKQLRLLWLGHIGHDYEPLTSFQSRDFSSVVSDTLNYLTSLPQFPPKTRKTS